MFLSSVDCSPTHPLPCTYFSPFPKIRTIQEHRATLAGEVLAHFLVAQHLTLACMEQTKEKGLLETLSKGEVLTAKHPGEFAGKQDTHVPVVTNTTVPPTARPSESVSRPDSCAAPHAGCCLFRSQAVRGGHIPCILLVTGIIANEYTHRSYAPRTSPTVGP